MVFFCLVWLFFGVFLGFFLIKGCSKGDPLLLYIRIVLGI